MRAKTVPRVRRGFRALPNPQNKKKTIQQTWKLTLKKMTDQNQCTCENPILQPQTKQCGRCKRYISRVRHMVLGLDISKDRYKPEKEAETNPTTYTFQTTDSQQAKRWMKADDMANFIFELVHNGWRQWKHDYSYDYMPAWEKIHELLAEHGVDIDDLIS